MANLLGVFSHAPPPLCGRLQIFSPPLPAIRPAKPPVLGQAPPRGRAFSPPIPHFGAFPRACLPCRRPLRIAQSRSSWYTLA